MSLAFLLDEHLSHAIAEQVRAKRPEISIHAFDTWRGGIFVGIGKRDPEVLTIAHEDGLTLVTYDQKTIPNLLLDFARRQRPHAGIVFVDNQTISPADFGGLVRALIALWDRTQTEFWENRIDFLRRAETGQTARRGIVSAA